MTKPNGSFFVVGDGLLNIACIIGLSFNLCMNELISRDGIDLVFCACISIIIVIICLDWDSLDRPLWLLTVTIFLCSYHSALNVIEHEKVIKVVNLCQFTLG